MRYQQLGDSDLRALEAELSEAEVQLLEELYVPHNLVGPMSADWRRLMLSVKDQRH